VREQLGEMRKLSEQSSEQLSEAERGLQLTTEQIPASVEVPLGSLVELAVECWRLERWLGAQPHEAQSSHGRHVARRLNRFLSDRELTFADMTGQKYEPGLAVEVLDTLEDAALPDGAGVIDETVSPIVMWRGLVVKYGQVVVRKRDEG
jgi:hypothetical protein